MKTSVQIFNSNKFGQVRAITINKEPYFVARDVATALGYLRPENAIAQHVDSDDTLKQGIIDSMNREQVTTLINESGVYSLIFGSKLPTAKAFKRWVTSEVLPAIRKHGGYLTPEKVEEALLNPDTLIQLAQQLKDERAKRVTAQNEVKKLAPKAELMDRVLDGDEKIDVGQAAKILGLSFGRNTLFQKLREMGIFFKSRNEPKQEYINRGYFVLKEKWIDRNTHDGFTVIKVLITQKGLEFLSNLFPTEKANKTTIKIA